MIGCTPAMVDWWLGFVHHTEEYRWWHPRDHVFSAWEGDSEPGKYIGRIHLVHEYLGAHLAKLKINFRDPERFWIRAASPKRRSGRLSMAMLER